VSTVLATVPGSHGAEHHILEARDGTPYCDCTGWKFSKTSPKTCKHLERYLLATGSYPSSSPVAGASTASRRGRHVPIGDTCDGNPIYEGEWVRDTSTDFVMRAWHHATTQYETQDHMWIIPANRTVLFIPAGSPDHPETKIAPCDLEAYRTATGRRPGHMPTTPIDGPSVLANLDWL